MKMRKLSMIAILTLALASLTAHAGEVTVKDGKVRFLAVGKPSLLKIKGEGQSLNGSATADVKGDQAKIGGTFTVDLKGLKTGIGMRDHHMQEKYLESEKFPQATLKLAPFSGKLGSEQEFKGDLTLKGVTKPVTGKATVTQSKAGEFEVKATFPIKLTDYPVGVPTFAGVTVADDVTVETEFTGHAK
ncbi:MAG TPA: YceI family protein [Bdellovibrionota bacterium]|jgi:polyisoprenoid-binding protein YceI|nr:YceI family protein [Bdellovibrionota bacterium]